MPVNLSIKNVPDELAERLRERAKRNHRSLQGELLSIIEAAVAPHGEMHIDEVWAEAKRAGLSSPDDSTAIIRADRDRDYRR
jgi:plasmid stability protein